MTNTEFELAEKFVLQTRKHCFVTGKAGTGKTTLLKRLVEHTRKNAVVVAPTGVAAINAGGTTIHSMFGLPLTCFVPNDDHVDPNVATNRQQLLREHLRLRRDKLRVLREMDLLIVDEVSMVRCDILDAIDLVLRTVRGNRQPFGEVQVLLIGDVHQLPPVAKDDQWSVLKSYYRSCYFFDSRVWPQLDAAQIELQTIYRQSDERFLSLLNNIRNRRLDADDARRLEERYQPNFRPPESGYVQLTTHNRSADSINSAELADLAGNAHSFAAQIEGEFPEHLFPCDALLYLKVGAQVMFIRNDTEAGAYYNGKLAIVKRVEGMEVTVTFRDSGQDYTLHHEVWENIGYGVEAESGRIVKQELGTFSQYPLRLAWAITIHKSQGLTFDKIIVDAGRSFAAGQVYVALSRCRTLEGIVLHSRITASALHDDQRISEFSGTHHAAGDLHEVFAREKVLYANYQLLKLFSFADLAAHLEEWQELITNKKLPDKQAASALHERIRAAASDIEVTAGKFQRELRRLIDTGQSDRIHALLLRERCGKAIAYFTEQIGTQFIVPLREHIAALAYRSKVKRYVNHLQLIEKNCRCRIERLYSAEFLGEKLYGADVVHTWDKLAPAVTSVTSARKEKGGSFKDTLDLQRAGKTAAEIAAIRGLSLGTIKSHLARWIASGEIAVDEVLPAATIEPVRAFLQEHAGATLTEIRAGTGDRIDYNDIRMVVAHCSRN